MGHRLPQHLEVPEGHAAVAPAPAAAQVVVLQQAHPQQHRAEGLAVVGVVDREEQLDLEAGAGGDPLHLSGVGGGGEHVDGGLPFHLGVGEVGVHLAPALAGGLAVLVEDLQLLQQAGVADDEADGLQGPLAGDAEGAAEGARPAPASVFRLGLAPVDADGRVASVGLHQDLEGLAQGPGEEGAHLALKGGVGDVGPAGHRVADHHVVQAADLHPGPRPADPQAGQGLQGPGDHDLPL
jgi:hypothetical protein